MATPFAPIDEGKDVVMPEDLISLDPCTGEEVWRGPVGDVDLVAERARAAFPAWVRQPLAGRIAIARVFQQALRDRAEAFTRLIARETGKPLWESRTEVQACIGKVDISIAAQAERAGSRTGEAGAVRQSLRHKPHGVLAVLGPYNFPAHLPNGHIVPALLAGNAVLFKPSEKAPAVAAFLRDCWAAAGLPAGVLEIVQGGPAQGRALVAHPGVDGVLFTGSAQAGAAIHRAFAETPHRILAIEAGGNNPLVAWDIDETDLDAAAAAIVQSAFLTAGQRCTCARRLIVGEDADALIDRVATLADRLVIGAPFDDPQPFMGPVIDEGAATTLEASFAAIEAAGGRVIRPLRRLTNGRPFLSPAIVETTGLILPDEEMFGPILKVERVADFTAAMAAANATRFGLSAALLGGDASLYERFHEESRAGIVNWNRPTNGAASNAPFGGVGASGNHRPSAYYAADYCAWPVASLEADTIESPVLQGLRA
jgi:succinylglutamic semialdehyde dehydrogenase